MAHSVQHEDALIRRAAQGDAAAFDCLVEQYTPRVYALAYRMVGNSEDAQDIAQEAFVRVYHALPRYKGEAAFSTWLYRIVTNVCYDDLKRRRRRPATFTDLEHEEGDARAETLAGGESPEDAALRLERRRAVQAAITTLPEHFRAVLVLYDLQGFSYQEIADILKQRVGTVKSRLNRARNLLREKLEDCRELFPTGGGPTS
ncbi:MAG TPA: sigma-70 family RNA polymerase sigma factor [Armatimonadota bacterium]|nr:sigma-70 family RNA polymerase sigma factor [Armatimonadota bacterium]